MRPIDVSAHFDFVVSTVPYVGDDLNVGWGYIGGEVVYVLKVNTKKKKFTALRFIPRSN